MIVPKKITIIGGKEGTHIELKGGYIEQVDSFSYLESYGKDDTLYSTLNRLKQGSLE